MEPHEKIRDLFFIELRKIFVLLGHDFYRQAEFKPYFLTFCMYLSYSTFYFGVVKTIMFYSMVETLNMIAFVGVALQVNANQFESSGEAVSRILYFMKIYFFQLGIKMYCVKYGYALTPGFNKLVDVYTANAKNVPYKRLMLVQRFATITEWIFKGGFVVYGFACLFYLINPIYSYFIKKRLPLYMPFVDESTKSGFIALMGIHFAYMFLTVVSSVGVDFIFVMTIINIPLLAIIFGDNVQELNKILREENVNEKVAKAKLRNTLLMQREIWE